MSRGFVLIYRFFRSILLHVSCGCRLLVWHKQYRCRCQGRTNLRAIVAPTFRFVADHTHLSQFDWLHFHCLLHFHQIIFLFIFEFPLCSCQSMHSGIKWSIVGDISVNWAIDSNHLSRPSWPFITLWCPTNTVWLLPPDYFGHVPNSKTIEAS